MSFNFSKSKKAFSSLLSLFPLLLILVYAAPEWRQASPDQTWSFPQDHWPKPEYKVEWWYLTGHLQDRPNDSANFAFQLTFFRIGLVPRDLQSENQWSTRHAIMSHLAFSDLEGEEHWFSETIYRQVPLLAGILEHPDNPIIWTQAPPGTDARWSLRWNGNGFDIFARDDSQGLYLDLRTTIERPILFQGPDGFSPKSISNDSASLYYSFTRLQTEGSLSVTGKAREVSGVTWMDREITSGVLADGSVGWDWVSLQLEDGRDLMSYRLRDDSGQPVYQWATVRDGHELPTYYSQSDLEWEPREWWTSPATGARYPVSWRIQIPSEELDLIVHRVFPEQENVSRLLPQLYYWEGAVKAFITGRSDRAAGRGFLELTGYGDGKRLPL